MSRLAIKYKGTIAPEMMKEFGYKNVYQVPKVKKVVINMGIKEGATDIKFLDQATVELSRITGQRPVITRAKKAIAGFKIRKGSPIGLKVDLRRVRMYEFMDRFFNIACPRIRDFRGFSPRSFDKNNNYSVGIKEQIIFPEVEYDKIKKLQGMDITFVTTAATKEESQKLLEHFGMPFRK